MRAHAFLIALIATVAIGARASADPQISTGVTVGGAITNLRDGSGPRPAFHLGFRGDVLFLRSRENQMAIGPYVEALTERFNSVDLGGGIEWLIPAIPSIPFVLSAGPYVRNAEGYGGFQPGVASTLFFGPRSFNFSSIYGMANGLFFQSRMGFGDAKQADLLLGVQVDFEILALPWIFAYQGIAH
ncbi:MAG TPA: hypothetical protein VF407_09885 [Polyangiaceae bacterium]